MPQPPKQLLNKSRSTSNQPISIPNSGVHNYIIWLGRGFRKPFVKFFTVQNDSYKLMNGTLAQALKGDK